jgi:hypothetical protein
MGGHILAGRKGQPIILDNMAKRAIVPALEKCLVCSELRDDHKIGEHLFKRDASLPQWCGWYSLRRFLGTEVRMHRIVRRARKPWAIRKPLLIGTTSSRRQFSPMYGKQ